MSKGNGARARGLGKPPPRWWRVLVILEVRVKAFGISRWWSEHLARRGGVFFAHQNLKPRAGPRQVFSHPSRRVTPDHGGNAGIFERALGQVRFGAATVA